jgi:hypothetical protein
MLSGYLPVIAMLKRTSKIFSTWRGQKVTLEGLHRRIKKRPGKARILSSVVVTIASGQMVKIVFVRDRRKSDTGNGARPMIEPSATCSAPRVTKPETISLLEALQRILTLVADDLRRIELTSEQFIQQLINDIMGTIIQKMNLQPANTPHLIAAK